MKRSDKDNFIQKRLTLKEMAQRLNRCPKTFRKYVSEYQIPHIRLGRDMLFDAVEVETYLQNLTDPPNRKDEMKKPITCPQKGKKNFQIIDKSKNRYANLLGLS